MPRGKPCGASHISAAYTCRVGGGSYSIGDQWGEKGAKVAKALERYDQKLVETLPPEAHAMWRRAAQDAIDNHQGRIGSYVEGGRNKPLEDRLENQLRKGERMMENQPTTLTFGDITMEAPPGMTPDFAWVHTGFRDDALNMKFNEPVNGVASVKLQSGGAGWTQVHMKGEIQAIVDFKAKQEAAGKPFPMEPVRTPSESEIQSVLAAHRGKLWSSGGNTLDSNGRQDIVGYYGGLKGAVSKEVQARRDAKERATVVSWLSHDRRDPVTGLKIGLTDTPGVTIDHKVPFAQIARGLPKDVPPSMYAKFTDTAENFHITKGGPQGLRKETPWDQWLAQPNANPTSWARNVEKRSKKNPPVMGLSRAQFEARYPGLNYNSAADRNRAAADWRAGFLRRIGGDSTALRAQSVSAQPKSPKPTRRRRVKKAATPSVKPARLLPSKSALEQRLAKTEELLLAAKRDKRSGDVGLHERTIANLKKAIAKA